MSILFYDEVLNYKYYPFSNFYKHKHLLKLNENEWDSVESYFQSKKYDHPLNDPNTIFTYQYIISKADTPNKAYILGNALFSHGHKNKWTVGNNVKSLINPENNMTLNEAIAIFTNSKIDEKWVNSKILREYRNFGRETISEIIQLTYNEDWWNREKINIMINALIIKFQDTELKKLLLETGDLEIREHTTRDKEWADGGKNGGGKNLLGQSLMHIRANLRNRVYNINLNYESSKILEELKIFNNKGSYVKLNDNLYYGIHPSIVNPDIIVDHYINFTEEGEVDEHDFDFKRFAIKDRDAPTLKYIMEIIEYLLTLEGKIYLFCKGGHGRSGTIASALYGKLNNLTGKEAIDYVNKEWHNQRDLEKLRPAVRKLGSPQNQKQKNIVINYLS